ncbi:tetraacyldisaccharide 4'-kinase [Marinobacter sp. M216]|uniref:Tetraacyldisaccharide 4'-kinase n=1 Tax=Marinobacter albus TaxID=3030833 RepID=A0ABT7HB62_9GAMM|nr:MULTISPECIES: tetraacyldisaccharide 4'-kinase [unclassified Marinobacter]MBW7470143.1 tetraacyldisaccharide 4'-kinase [Marinobacter sp. F4218]MDK9557593.1 tetraacyldisaccharide 4'-kinase [Marinobacter sp. M216]
MSSLIDRLWYGTGRPLGFLAPLSWIFQAITASRRRKAWDARDEVLPVPVVVVGNITAGGTGKSPLTARLVAEFRAAGWRPVVLSRGYGGKAAQYPLLVQGDSEPSQAGDEPVMLARATNTPVVVDPQRRRGAAWALEQGLGDILISDDGLQHYALPRDIEIAVFDGVRGTGNGALIPVGPLREPVSRLASVDFVVVNGGDFEEGGHIESFQGIEHPQIFTMALEPSSLTNLKTGESRPLSDLTGRHVRAVAGIGNPERFFDTLRSLGAVVEGTAFPDHHDFRASDLDAESGRWVVITAKDAVKCQGFAKDNVWVFSVQARLDPEFIGAVLSRIRQDSEQILS